MIIEGKVGRQWTATINGRIKNQERIRSGLTRVSCQTNSLVREHRWEARDDGYASAHFIGPNLQHAHALLGVKVRPLASVAIHRHRLDAVTQDPPRVMAQRRLVDSFVSCQWKRHGRDDTGDVNAAHSVLLQSSCTVSPPSRMRGPFAAQ